MTRSYRQQGERYWVVELPDGSRQYVPAAWCLPLTTALPVMAASGREMEPGMPTDRIPSPLSLPVLRELATLVRGLQEARRPDGGEHSDAIALPATQAACQPTTLPEPAPAADQPERDTAALGEFCRGGSPTAGAAVGADGPRADPGAAAPLPRGEVNGDER